MAAFFNLPNGRGVSIRNLFWLPDVQMERLRPFYPKSHGRPRVDDRRVLSGTEEGSKTVWGSVFPKTLHQSQWLTVA